MSEKIPPSYKKPFRKEDEIILKTREIPYHPVIQEFECYFRTCEPYYNEEPSHDKYTSQYAVNSKSLFLQKEIMISSFPHEIYQEITTFTKHKES